MQVMSKAEKTKAFIIEKTAPIFNKKGYAGTSLTDLTTATGLTKGALYGNFKSKTEIAVAAYDYNINRVRNNFLLDKKVIRGDSIKRLLDIPLFYKEHYQSIAAHGGCPILNTAVEADDNQPVLKKKVNNTILKWKKYLSVTIEDGMKEGTIKPGTDPGKYACIFIALFEGGLMLSKTTGDICYINHALDKMTEIINTELKA
jgi:TetR/AcrR family transcriptional regulator, transcriptional repressor for nem operon